MEYRGFNYVVPKGTAEINYRASLEKHHLKIIKNSLLCQVEDATKRGFVTVLTRFRGAWNGKTYNCGKWVVTHKGA